MNTSAPPAQHVPLPELSAELLRRRGSGGQTWDDARRYPRLDADDQGLLQPEFTFPARATEIGSQDVWVRDLARGGVRFIHGAQIFPSERYALTLAASICVHVEVVWCRRIANGIFVSGCLFVASEHHTGES